MQQAVRFFFPLQHLLLLCLLLQFSKQTLWLLQHLLIMKDWPLILIDHTLQTHFVSLACVGLAITLKGAIRLPSQVGWLFTHANYIGPKPDHKKLVTLFFIHIATRLKKKQIVYFVVVIKIKISVECRWMVWVKIAHIGVVRVNLRYTFRLARPSS